MEQIPYYVHEGMMVRMERTIKRLWILCIIIFLAFVASNAAWIWYENQFIDEVTTIEASTDDGGTAIANSSGEVTYYGEGESND